MEDSYVVHLYLVSQDIVQYTVFANTYLYSLVDILYAAAFSLFRFNSCFGLAVE